MAPPSGELEKAVIYRHASLDEVARRDTRLGVLVGDALPKVPIVAHVMHEDRRGGEGKRRQENGKRRKVKGKAGRGCLNISYL